jgi:hypothetical protein
MACVEGNGAVNPREFVEENELGVPGIECTLRVALKECTKILSIISFGIGAAFGGIRNRDRDRE